MNVIIDGKEYVEKEGATRQKLSDFSKDEIRHAIRAIRGGFIWDLTKEGRYYWQDVVDKLDKLTR